MFKLFHKLLLVFLIAPWISPAAASSGPQRTDHVEAELVAEVQSVEPGSTFWIALRLTMAPKWHTYWINPGDAGQSTSLDWDNPAGVEVGEILWPTPMIYLQGDIVNYVYEDTVYLMMPVTVPADWNGGDTLTLRARADWLECDDKLCVPGSVELSLSLPVSGGTPAWDESERAVFEATRDALPRVWSDDWAVTVYQRRDQLLLVLEPLSDAARVVEPQDMYFFSEDQRVDPAAAQRPVRVEGKPALLLTESRFATGKMTGLPGVIVSGKSWLEGENLSSMALLPELAEGWPRTEAFYDGESDAGVFGLPSYGLTLLLAFAGGLILNLMPCVFPVLGLKVMGFVNQAGETRAKVVQHGLVFTLGVLLSFWALALLLIMLRSGGESLGWGFQLQSPGFVLALSVFLFVFALNLSGLFEIGYSAMGVGSGLAAKQGLSGSFFSGVLATVVATPCAAPFLAPALGAALALEPVDSLFVFTIIALGLATPYLLLSIFPQMVNKLPRPGPWMETFKQAMAFPLYATVAYLLWVLAGQIAPDHFLNVLFALTGVAVAVWIYGRWATPAKKATVRWRACGLTLVVLGASLWLGFHTPPKLDWEPWSPERIEAALEEGRPVYVDFTARWCATCQVNKKAVFSSNRVLSTFSRERVLLLQADWTNRDPAITEALAGFGRAAVPFNLIYTPERDEPVILPELLTPDIVLNALKKAQE
jgi:DsbC/DsbD-like thiol-disulfide interchange protein/cytochrome c biogenesis protein CcdA